MNSAESSQETTSEQEQRPTVILFLGDSITADGRYIRMVEKELRARGETIHLIARGVPSETVSGLSEKGHPGPRPCLHDRLDAVLEKTKPDRVVACYGMNDGIYHPFAEERFAAYRAGIGKLRDRVAEAGISIWLLTPPPFDAYSFTGTVLKQDATDFSYLTPYRGYDDVLRQYAEWLLQSDPASGTVDLRTPMMEAIRQARRLDPHYSSGDGIHPDKAGHVVMAAALLNVPEITNGKY